MTAYRVSLLLVLLSLPASAFAQLGKGLQFAQIAFGGGYETVLNVTNRGTVVFNGKLNLLPSDNSKPFPAFVNGNSAFNGVNIALAPGATASFSITSGDASAGTLSGFAVIGDASNISPNLLEGNLTYYVKSADGTIVDSVGVAPSRPLRHTVIPFDDFETVALALANNDGQTATATLELFDDKSNQVGTASLTLADLQQVPRFLYQFFPGVTLTRGRVEIKSDFPLLGTALTFVKGGQASSLPFLPAIQLYNVTSGTPGSIDTSQAYVTIDGPYVTGYTVETANGVPQPNSINQLTGLLANGNLEIYVHSGRGTDHENVAYVLIPGFSPSQRNLSGTAEVYFVNPASFAGQASVTLTAVN